MSEHSTISLERTRLPVHSLRGVQFILIIILHTTNRLYHTENSLFALYNENLNVQAEGNIRESE
jgi:hypothetical protein